MRFSIGPSFSKIPDPNYIRISTCGFWFLKRHLIGKHETLLGQPHMRAVYNWSSRLHPAIGIGLICFVFGSLIFEKGTWVLFSLPPCHQVWDYTSQVSSDKLDYVSSGCVSCRFGGCLFQTLSELLLKAFAKS